MKITLTKDIWHEGKQYAKDETLEVTESGAAWLIDQKAAEPDKAKPKDKEAK